MAGAGGAIVVWDLLRETFSVSSPIHGHIPSPDPLHCLFTSPFSYFFSLQMLSLSKENQGAKCPQSLLLVSPAA